MRLFVWLSVLGLLVSFASGCRRRAPRAPTAVIVQRPVGPAVAPAARVTRTRSPHGYTVLTTRMMLNDGYVLNVSAAPAQEHERVVLDLMHTAMGLPQLHRECTSRLMIDGQLGELPTQQYRVESGMEHVPMVATIQHLEALARAQRAAGRICDDEWRFDPASQRVLSDFIAAFHEELQWATVPESRPH